MDMILAVPKWWRLSRIRSIQFEDEVAANKDMVYVRYRDFGIQAIPIDLREGV